MISSATIAPHYLDPGVAPPWISKICPFMKAAFFLQKNATFPDRPNRFSKSVCISLPA
jgi:hypothetical protein